MRTHLDPTRGAWWTAGFIFTVVLVVSVAALFYHLSGGASAFDLPREFQSNL